MTQVAVGFEQGGQGRTGDRDRAVRAVSHEDCAGAGTNVQAGVRDAIELNLRGCVEQVDAAVPDADAVERLPFNFAGSLDKRLTFAIAERVKLLEKLLALLVVHREVPTGGGWKGPRSPVGSGAIRKRDGGDEIAKGRI